MAPLSLNVFYVALEFKRSLMIKTVKIQIIVGTIAPQFVGRKPQKSNAYLISEMIFCLVLINENHFIFLEHRRL